MAIPATHCCAHLHLVFTGWPTASTAATIPSCLLPLDRPLLTGLTPASRKPHPERPLITKVYFPRLIIPLASICGVVVDLALATVVLVGMMLAYGIAPTLGLIWVPLFVVIASISAIGIGALLAALNVRYRDVRYIIPLLVQMWIFIRPSFSPSRWSRIGGDGLCVNPMVGRGGLLGLPREAISGRDLLISRSSIGSVLRLLFGRMNTRLRTE